MDGYARYYDGIEEDEMTKLAADLQRGDAVLIAPGDRRVVERVEFRDQPIAAVDSCVVVVWWFGRTATSLLRPDQEMTITL